MNQDNIYVPLSQSSKLGMLRILNSIMMTKIGFYIILLVKM